MTIPFWIEVIESKKMEGRVTLIILNNSLPSNSHSSLYLNTHLIFACMYEAHHLFEIKFSSCCFFLCMLLCFLRKWSIFFFKIIINCKVAYSLCCHTKTCLVLLQSVLELAVPPPSKTLKLFKYGSAIINFYYVPLFTLWSIKSLSRYPNRIAWHD